MSDRYRRLPPLATLAPFEAAFRHRNFTRAAEELHTSQASVSRRIRQLEADLGIDLFERHRHDVTPTAEAAILAAAVRLSLDELSSAADLLRRRGGEATTLTIFSDLTLATTLVAPVLGDFQRRHPDLQVRVISSFEPIEDTAEDFDIGLQYGTRGRSRFLVEPIADDSVFPVCSPRFAADLVPDLAVADLLRLPLLHVAYPDPDWTDWSEFLAFAGLAEPVPAERLVFTSYHVCLDVAEQGEGVALGWERSVGPRLDAGNLVRLTDVTMPHPGVINAYRPSGRAATTHGDEFLTLLRASVDAPG